MKPVAQSIVDKGRGDCMRAVVASLFELELDQVPHFILYGDDYFDHFWKWLWIIGYDYNGCGYPHCRQDVSDKYNIPNKPLMEDSVNGYFYGCVPSRTFPDVTHAVVIDTNGVVVHDPNPNKLWEGINVIESGELKYWFLLNKLDGDRTIECKVDLPSDFSEVDREETVQQEV